MANNMVNWEVFFGNSSTEEALAEFVVDIHSFQTLKIGCYYHKNCVLEIDKMKHRGYKKSRKMLDRLC